MEAKKKKVTPQQARAFTLGEIISAENMMVTQDILRFISDTSPDVMWCTDPEFHPHDLATVEEIICVLAGADYVAN